MLLGEALQRWMAMSWRDSTGDVSLKGPTPGWC